MKRKFKTVRKLGGPMKFRKWSDWEVGDVLIGKYESVRTDQYDKTNRVLSVLEAQFKDGSGHEYDGKNICLNACGSLDFWFEEAEEPVVKGDIVQIEYCGKEVMEKGPYAGKDFHSISIAVVTDEEDDYEGYDDTDL